MAGARLRPARPVIPVRTRLLVFLAAIGGFLPLVTDGFLPAVRPMMAELGATVSSAQLATSLALAGFACAQLLIGVAADRFGRRPVLLAAMVLFICASAGAGAAPSLPVLLLFRFLQGFCAAAGPVISRAVVRDTCVRLEGARVLSLVGMGMGAIPLVIPTINAQVEIWFGWRATSIVYLIYLAATLAMALAWFEETLAAPDPRALSVTELAKAVRAVLSHRQALGYILCCMFGYAGLAVWISSAPHLVLGYFHQSAASLGLWWALPVLTYVLGGYLSARGLTRYSSDTMLRVGSFVLLSAGAALVLLLGTERMPLYAFVAAVATYNCGWAIVQPHAQAGALSFFPSYAGRVSAILGFLQMLGAAAIGLAFGALHDGTPRAAALLIAATALATNAVRVMLAMRRVNAAGGLQL